MSDWIRTIVPPFIPTGATLCCAYGVIGGQDVAIVGGIRVPCSSTVEAQWFSTAVAARAPTSLDALERSLKPAWAARVREARNA